MQSNDATAPGRSAPGRFMTPFRSLRRPLLVLAFLAAAALTLAACGSSSSSGGGSSSGSLSTSNPTGLFGTLPPVGTPKSGGTITIGQISGQTPTYIFPIIPGANTSTGTISMVSNLWMPLYAGPKGASPVIVYGLSAASGPPVPSDQDKTYTIPLKTNLKWSNGDPVDANDLIFAIDLLKAAVKESAANWGQFVPGEFPTSVVSMKASGKYKVIVHLDKAYNPGFFLNNQLSVTNNFYPLPSRAWNVAAAGGPHLDYTNPANAKKIYDYLNKAGGSLSTFASNPLWQVVNGPFKLKSFSAGNGSYSMVANPSYGGTPKPAVSTVSLQTYTGFTAELNALKSGGLDIATGIDPSQLAQRGSLKAQGIEIWGGPSWGWFGGIINFKDTTNHFDKVISQLYVRQAMAHLIDQPSIIKGVYKGAAVPAYGPIPSAPPSPYVPANALSAPYPYDPAAAASLLKSHGWNVVPNGQTTCAKPGTGAGQCGAGIPAGTPIKFTWANVPKGTSTTGPLESEVFASQAKQAAGITVDLVTKTFNFLTSNYNNANPAAAKYTNDWGVNNYGGLFENYYPTQDGTLNPGAGFNMGSFNDPTLNSLIHSSVYGGDPSAVKTEASYVTKIAPIFYFPDQDFLLAANTKKVGGTADGWMALTQQQWYPQYLYLVK